MLTIDESPAFDTLTLSFTMSSSISIYLVWKSKGRRKGEPKGSVSLENHLDAIKLIPQILLSPAPHQFNQLEEI